MNDVKNDISEEQLDKIVHKIVKREKRSSWVSVIIVLVILSLLALILVFGKKTIESKDIEIENAEKKERQLVTDIKKKDEFLKGKDSIINYVITNKNVNDSIKEKIEQQQELIEYRTRDIKLGDSLYVWAKSGIQMRLSPSTSGERIGSNNLGEFVILQESNLDSISFINDKWVINDKIEIPISGNWLKVKRFREGYMYDGYLSRLPSYSENLNLQQYSQKIPSYIKSRFQVVYQQSGESLSEHLVLKDITNNEALLLAIRLLEIDNPEINNDLLFTKTYNNWNFISQNCNININRKGNEIIITKTCS